MESLGVNDQVDCLPRLRAAMACKGAECIWQPDVSEVAKTLNWSSACGIDGASWSALDGVQRYIAAKLPPIPGGH